MLARSGAVLHALGQYGNAVLARGKIDVGGLHEESQNWFNRLKRRENALGLSLQSFVGPENGWTYERRKDK